MIENRCKEYVRSHAKRPRTLTLKPWIRTTLKLLGGLALVLIGAGVADGWSTQARFQDIAARGRTTEGTVVSVHSTGGKHSSTRATVSFRDDAGGLRRITESVHGELREACTQGAKVEVTYVQGGLTESFIGNARTRVSLAWREVAGLLPILLVPASIFLLFLVLVLRERHLLRNGTVCSGTIDEADRRRVRFTYRGPGGQPLQGTMRVLPYIPLFGYNPAAVLEPESHEPVVYLDTDPSRATLVRYAVFWSAGRAGRDP